jgi:hypothetical protein
MKKTFITTLLLSAVGISHLFATTGTATGTEASTMGAAVVGSSATTGASSVAAVVAPAVAANPGQVYVNTVVTTLGNALLPDYNILSTVIAAYIIPTDPNVDAATVCLEQASNGRIYRLHSRSSSSNGIVTNTGDLAVFNADFFTKSKGDDINFSTPDSSKPGTVKTFVGKVVAKLGSVICFARYRSN